MAGTLQRLRGQIKTLQASIFETLNPSSNVRTGNKILRQRLRGQALLQYYPQTVANGAYAPIKANEITRGLDRFSVNGTGKYGALGLDAEGNGSVLVDVDEEIRLTKLARRRARNKGPPKKGQGKRASLKKR